MSDQNAVAPDMGALNEALLIPTSWETPKEDVYGKIVAFGVRWSTPEYNAATNFRGAFPVRRHPDGKGGFVEHNSIQQLVINVERFDAVYVHEDGSPFQTADGPKPQIPVIAYAGVDLERYDEKKGVVESLMKRAGKAQYVITKWTEKVGQLTPNPERFVGMNVHLVRYPELQISRSGSPATNVYEPVEILAPDYKWTGEVRPFKAKADVNDAAVASAAEAGLAGAAPTVSKEELAAKLGEYLTAKGVFDQTALSLPDFPAECRTDPFLTALALGTIRETLAGFGVSI